MFYSFIVSNEVISLYMRGRLTEYMHTASPNDSKRLMTPLLRSNLIGCSRFCIDSIWMHPVRQVSGLEIFMDSNIWMFRCMNVRRFE